MCVRYLQEQWVPGKNNLRKTIYNAQNDGNYIIILKRDDGPAISMEKTDHRQTASYGSSREAREYRAQQRELIEDGKFEKAMQMDIDDIHEKFGDKYNNAIDQMLDYKKQLKQEGRI